MGFLTKKDNKKIKVRIILEILGRPKEHIMEVLKELVERINKEKGIQVTNKTINEAKVFERKDEKGNIIPKREEEQELYSTFAEIEFEAAEVTDLLAVCFTYMPANVEIIEPEAFELKNLDFNSLINEIIRRLHHYDSLAKTALMHNQILGKQIEAIKQNVDSKTLRQKLEQIANPPSQEEDTKEKAVKNNSKSKKKKR
ncbi:hypothetical protein FJZ17_02710 [Candidatus Pacearchaeota archaeon]|nr:hypothetical protein [Candidatus Pacearchaeota archaeon]